MKVIDETGNAQDYTFANIGQIMVELQEGTRFENLFFRVKNSAIVPGIMCRYESPKAYFKFRDLTDESSENELADIETNWLNKRNQMIDEWITTRGEDTVFNEPITFH